MTDVSTELPVLSDEVVSRLTRVVGIVAIANEFAVPVWPHGQGKSLSYGGPSPRVRGSTQIGFQKMNRVLEINDELAYAVVEPGVRWFDLFDLFDALEAGGHSLMLSVPDLGWGSVIGSSMDSGITYMPDGRAGTGSGRARTASSIRHPKREGS